MRNSTKYNKVVNVDEFGTITVLEDIFSYDDGMKGATGFELEPVSREAYEETAGDFEALVEFLMDASQLPEGYRSYDDWAEAIVANGEAADVFYDQSFCGCWDDIRAELGLSEDEAYIFNCVGCGRIFSKNFQGNRNPELSKVIREAEA